MNLEIFNKGNILLCTGTVTSKENYLLIFKPASEFEEWLGSGSYSQYSW